MRWWLIVVARGRRTGVLQPNKTLFQALNRLLKLVDGCPLSGGIVTEMLQSHILVR